MAKGILQLYMRPKAIRPRPPPAAAHAAEPAPPLDQAANLARGKAQLEALAKTLVLPLPLLLALAAALMTRQQSMSFSGATLRLDLAQVLVMVSVAVALLRCGRAAWALGQGLAVARGNAAFTAMLQDNADAMNPFAAWPRDDSKTWLVRQFWNVVFWPQAGLPIISAGIVLGIAMGFLNPVTSPYADTPWCFWLLLGLAGLHTYGTASAMWGVMGVLFALKRAGSAVVFAFALMCGVAAGVGAAMLVQDIRAQAEVPAPAATPGPSLAPVPGAVRR